MAREMLAECKSVLLEQAHWVVAEEMTILCFLKGFSTETWIKGTLRAVLP